MPKNIAALGRQGSRARWAAIVASALAYLFAQLSVAAHAADGDAEHFGASCAACVAATSLDDVCEPPVASLQIHEPPRGSIVVRRAVGACRRAAALAFSSRAPPSV